MDPETLQLITGAISIIACIAFPAAAMKIKALKEIADEVIIHVKRDPKENKEIFKTAKEAGLKNLADHINKKVDPHLDFYK